MRESRRVFLGLAFGAAATAAGASRQFANPQDATSPVPVPPSNIPQFPPMPKRAPDNLKANQVAIKKDVARLNELVGELQTGLDNSDTKQVLSLDVIHKTEEIEKLAKQIRELVRG